ncbi:hypothetical protein LRS03_24195 [Rhizobacter sp. J219]|uniref:hypothetical protein n=1 Tax=Rhizobacter sp. J219 TaxID=2898430 RepID=UPI0021517D59|nr:hypothetical protein [Rhizobacter sp. J219]MCR5885789.1 hypothetical protein [Rhizobacter sp. J219]
MKLLNEAGARDYLDRNGVTNPVIVKAILDGFDLGKPMYEQRLEPDTELFQFMRRPSAGKPDLRVGNWFCLPGASRSGLAIMDGLSGRETHRFQVGSELVALEGTASRLSLNWEYEIGGQGGHTQLYVPPRLLGHIRSLGNAHPW